MQRFLNAILFLCFILCFLTIYPQNASSEILDNVISIEPAVYNKANVITKNPQAQFAVSCVEIYTGKKIGCSHVVTILSPISENCFGGEGIKCGHNDASHTVSRATILSNNNNDTFQILGWLSDASNTKTTYLQSPSVDYYFYNFFSGEISGMLSIKEMSSGLPPGWGFLPPCESRATCTIIHPVMTRTRSDFYELASPQTPDDGYVRCGSQQDCLANNLPDRLPPGTDSVKWLEYDDPYNWPAHPTTDWGQLYFLIELNYLAKKWYKNFQKPLVTNDISLPYGGLLDVDLMWTANLGHSSHRQGIDADIIRVSVPENMRPIGPNDEAWVEIYGENKLLANSNLTYLKGDYNHLRATKSFNLFFMFP